MHRHYLVSGRVQGVGFREFTKSVAQRLELRGLVRNLRDGRVEIVASGSADAIQEFERAIGRGPDGAWVNGIESETWKNESEAIGSVRGFDRVQNGETPWVK